MTDHPHDTGSSIEPGTNTGRWWDAKLLQETVREAIRTSPESFLRTVSDVDARPLNYWLEELRSSTWAVAQRDGDVIGIAAAKYPNPEKDKEDPATTRYIESVWIDPDFRGNRFGELLIQYLLEAECQKNQHINQFLLWVFETNSPAISLYEHIGFVRTPERNEGVRTEIKYRLDLGSVVNSAVRSAVDEAACRQDQPRHRVTYRILGGRDSA